MFERQGWHLFFLALLLGGASRSEAALLAAAFNHLCIWVHYYITELPGMRRNYARPAE